MKQAIAGLLAFVAAGCAARASAQVVLVSGFNSSNVAEFSATSGAYLGDFVTAGAGGLSSAEQLAITPGGSLLVSSYGSNQVLRYDGTTGAFQGVFASIARPTGLLIRGHDVFVSSYSASGFVNRYDADTGAPLGTFVGAGSGGLGRAHAMTFGPNGNLFVADNDNDRVGQYDGATGAFVNLFATGGGLSGPTGVVFGPDGNLYVSSDLNNKVARFSGSTGASLGDFVLSGSGGLTGPHGLIFRGDGELYVSGGSTVSRFDATTGAFFDQFAVSGALQRATYMTFTPIPVPSSALLLIVVAVGASVIRFSTHARCGT
jgi:streptogramin lyase